MNKIRNCVTHHYACDCREELHRKEIESLKKELESAKDVKDKLLKELKLLMSDGDYKILLKELNK